MHHAQRNLLLYLVLTASIARVASTQEPAPVESPRFEVASIKAVDPNGPVTMGVCVYPGGRVTVAGFPLKALIATAFDLRYWQISGGAEWVSKDNYVIEAKPPDAQRSSIRSLRYTLFDIDDPLLRHMLQALLVDRFQLKFHRETKAGDVYLLERNNKPLALNSAKIPNGASESDRFGSVGYAGGKWVIVATTMPQLARFASMAIFRAPVLDRTELTGSFDYRQPQPDLEPQYTGDQTASFKAFLSQAGLKWERSKGPVGTLIIDYAAKPTPN